MARTVIFGLAFRLVTFLPALQLYCVCYCLARQHQILHSVGLVHTSYTNSCTIVWPTDTGNYRWTGTALVDPNAFDDEDTNNTDLGEEGDEEHIGIGRTFTSEAESRTPDDLGAPRPAFAARAAHGQGSPTDLMMAKRYECAANKDDWPWPELDLKWCLVGWHSGLLVEKPL